MRFTFDGSADRLTVDLDSLGEGEGFFDRAERQEGFLAELPRALPRGKEVEVVIAAPGGFEVTVPATVLHVFGDPSTSEAFTTALELAGGGAAARAELGRRLASAGGGDRSGAAEPEPEPVGETLGASPIHRIRAMTPPERARLARKANRIERQILLRETAPLVMMALLQNPHLEADDVVQMIKSPYAPPGVLKRVAGDRRWASNPDVRLVLVRNPQTPTPLAVRLLPGLPTRALQVLARGGEAREELRKAALKVYLKRMGRS